MGFRRTIVTPPAEHYYSRYETIPGTKKAYAFLLIPGKYGVYYRRYICVSCNFCKKLDFLKCTNNYCGTWKFFAFDLNASTIYNFLVPIFPGKKKTNKIIKLIRKYYIMLPNPF